MFAIGFQHGLADRFRKLFAVPALGIDEREDIDVGGGTAVAEESPQVRYERGVAEPCGVYVAFGRVIDGNDGLNRDVRAADGLERRRLELLEAGPAVGRGPFGIDD